MTDFEKWCLTASSNMVRDGHPLPWVTLLLIRVCDNDVNKFNEALIILRAAFEDGKRVAGSDG
jgi:hypothetical protein